MATITRKVPDIAILPRIRLCDLKDLPGARKAVSYKITILKHQRATLLATSARSAAKDVVRDQSVERRAEEATRDKGKEVESQE